MKNGCEVCDQFSEMIFCASTLHGLAEGSETYVDIVVYFDAFPYRFVFRIASFLFRKDMVEPEQFSLREYEIHPFADETQQ